MVTSTDSKKVSPVALVEDSADDTIEQITADRSAHYEPFGWHHWPEHP